MASWFRSWHGAPTDTKWIVVARRANVIPGIVSAVFWELEDYASQADERGSVAGFDVETYCAFSGFLESDVTAIINALHDKGVIGPDDRLTAWDKRQPKREDDSTDRVRNWRAEKRNDVTPSLQQPVTHGNAMKRSVTHGNNTDTDTDTDTEQNRTENLAPAAHDDEIPPDVRAVRNAYDASGLMMTKTHLDAHLETIKRVGLVNWRLGWAGAMEKGKQNIPAMVARLAESARLQSERGNGHSKDLVPQTTEDRKAKYAPESYAGIIES